MAEVTLELLQAMVQRVLDNQMRVNERFFFLESRFTALEARFSAIETRFRVIEERIAGLEVHPDRIDRRLGLIDA